jgi:hypothetical protein
MILKGLWWEDKRDSRVLGIDEFSCPSFDSDGWVRRSFRGIPIGPQWGIVRAYPRVTKEGRYFVLKQGLGVKGKTERTLRFRATR